MTVRLIEGQVPYTGGTAIEITADKVINLLLRSEDNLLQVNQDNELYCDLQLANGIAPTDDFPVGVTTGIVNANDGRPYNGLLLHYETTSGAYAQWLYAGDGHFYLDGGTGTFKKIYYADEVDALFQQLVDMIGDGILTIQKNGTTVGTFTANQSTNTTVNITVPTALSDLTNDLVNDGKLTLKRNHTTIAEFTANDATNVIADYSVPEVINNTTTIDSANALSAAMGKELQDQINNLNMIGRFLSLWNCATGLPQTNPTTSPYAYHTGDYYVIGNVDATTNYKPDGGSYTIGVASTTVETATVGVGDMYFYDGTNWTLKKFTGQTFPIDNVLSTTSTNAVENRVITNALMQKLDAAEFNTKTFYLSGTNDLTTAQEIYDWYAAGKNPIMVHDDMVFVSSGMDSGSFRMESAITMRNNAFNFCTSIFGRNCLFSLNSGSVTGITFADSPLGNYLSTGVNYSTPYTPEYNGSPATKKYVDDSINTKTFYVSGSNDLITAQAILDYYLNGNNPILNTGSGATWIMTEDTGTNLIFSNDNLSSFNDPANYTTTEAQYVTWEITYSGTTATQITSVTHLNTGRLSPYLSTTINYAVPYTPVYNGSPTTKKYVDDKQKSISVTLLAANWSNKSITVIATGVTLGNTVIISPDPSSITDYADSSVYCSAQGTDTLTFSCDTEPTNDLTVNVVILN